MTLIEKHLSIDLEVMRPVGFHDRIYETCLKANEIVDQKSGWKNVSICPVCGSKDRHNWLLAYGNTIVQCLQCSHRYVTRCPVDITEIYNDEGHNSISIDSYHKNRTYPINRFATERVNLIKQFKEGGSLLDYGCGTGWFLEYAQKFFNVAGYEPSNQLNSLTSNILKRKIALNLNEYESNSFDVITAFDVIEHLPYPNEMVEQLKRILKPDGIILIYTPNSVSLGFENLKEKNNLITPHFHLHYFNINSIKTLFSKYFTLEYFQTFGLDVADIYAYERDHGDESRPDFLFSNIQILQSFIDSINFSNSMRCVFKKNVKIHQFYHIHRRLVLRVIYLSMMS